MMHSTPESPIYKIISFLLKRATAHNGMCKPFSLTSNIAAFAQQLLVSPFMQHTTHYNGSFEINRLDFNLWER
jgi:hypothetical protein